MCFDLGGFVSLKSRVWDGIRSGGCEEGADCVEWVIALVGSGELI